MCLKYIHFLPQDVVKGHERLNLAFVANLFNMHPGLEPPAQVETTWWLTLNLICQAVEIFAQEVDIEGIQETREEKVRFRDRNWWSKHFHIRLQPFRHSATG